MDLDAPDVLAEVTEQFGVTRRRWCRTDVAVLGELFRAMPARFVTVSAESLWL